MEEEAPSRRSVAELAGRFKAPAPPPDDAGTETEKPVRRRPPRSLQLQKPQGDEQEQAPEDTSPQPSKVKRNSSLIEKLQANLVLTSPTGPPKSPGFRMLPPGFVPPCPGSAPDATSSSTTTPTTPSSITLVTAEEGPTSFEEPPTAAEGSILQSINKGRARHSIRRRPPSRRHRKTSTGDNEGEDATPTTPSQPDDKTAGEGGGEKKEGGGEKKEGGGEKKEGGGEEDQTDSPEKDESSKDIPKDGTGLQGDEEKKEKKEEEMEVEVKEEEKMEEKKEEKMEVEEEKDGEQVKTEEKTSGEKQDDQTSADGKEEKSEETTSETSAL